MEAHRLWWLSVVVACSGLGCSKPADTAPPAASASASSPAPPPPPDEPVAWSGTYTSSAGSLYVYDGGEWKGVHFRGDDASDGLGEGALSLSVDPKTGQVRGTASGPLGDVVVTGAITGEEMTFSVVRKDPTDHGLTGTGAAKINEASMTGVMRLSRGDAHVIREAKFSLAKAKR